MKGKGVPGKRLKESLGEKGREDGDQRPLRCRKDCVLERVTMGAPPTHTVTTIEMKGGGVWDEAKL